ncbi:MULTISPECIES: NAD-dependent epimerase/dehydratase family protein [unclassified Microbacterium]|uniref:NAD-dependent epimerase/dehydratase family protein n=1 Tax=unclassified Microbacterium TaxID=2609290 RepID=UPI001604A460|nr:MULTISPECIES: NAD-dependent epimerase/dehydratase family protein [unclassified Microbacterium]QNA93035.1 reductase [Microbacterium sp. Se63.02b]QYM63210.1 reductase [Microbacterium sp. Se5.02b]
MTDVLILGGTGWLSGRVAAHALGAGATVTCLARGDRPAPSGASLVLADREDEDAYDVVSRTDWDHVVDVSSRADHVSAAVRALRDRAARWTYVSSMSVYRDDEVVGADESAPRLPAAQQEDDDYGLQKVAAEDAVLAGLGDRSLIVRPGLIVGDGDPSDRFGYWAAAFLRAPDEPVLVPPLESRTAQVVDVDDAAAFIVSAEVTGAVNAIGDVHGLADVIRTVRDAAGHTGPMVVGVEERLVAEGVAHWSGPRSLPLWLPPEMTGFMTRSNTRYRHNGGTLRSLADTVERVVADERERGVDRGRRAGLTRAEERALLDAFG